MKFTEEQLRQIKNKLSAINLKTEKIASEKEEINKLVKEIKEILNDDKDKDS